MDAEGLARRYGRGRGKRSGRGCFGGGARLEVSDDLLCAMAFAGRGVACDEDELCDGVSGTSGCGAGGPEREQRRGEESRGEERRAEERRGEKRRGEQRRAEERRAEERAYGHPAMSMC